MSMPECLLPFQRFAREWKDHIARRVQEDVEIASHFEEQKVAKEELLASKISALDQSQEIRAQSKVKIQDSDLRLEAQIAALREAHREELQNIEAWREQKMEENEAGIEQGKKALEEQEREREKEWETMRDKLRGLRGKEDEDARRRSMILLEEEGARLREVALTSYLTATTPSPGTRRTKTQYVRRRNARKQLDQHPATTDVRSSGPAVLTPSTSPAQQSKLDLDSGVDELQDEVQVTRSTLRRRRRLEDLPPLTSGSNSSKKSRHSEVSDLHPGKAAVANTLDANSEDESLY